MSVKIVLLKDCAFGFAGQRLTVSAGVAQSLIRNGSARKLSFKDALVCK